MQNKGQEWVGVKRSCHVLHSLRIDLTVPNARLNLCDLYHIYFCFKTQKCNIKATASRKPAV